MNQRASKAVAMPTVLVATLANRSGSRRRHKSGRLAPARDGIGTVVGAFGSIPKPSLGNLGKLAGGRKRRQRRSRMRKLAGNAGAVVSAVSVAAELAGTFRDFNGAGGNTKSAAKRAPNRTSVSPAKAAGAAKRAHASTKAAPTAKKTTPKKAAAARKKTTARKAAPISKRAITQRSSSNGSPSRNGQSNVHAGTNGRSGASQPRPKAATGS